jgi:hypothetical protein
MKRVLDGAEPYLTRKQLPNNVSVASLDLDALAAAAAGGITAASGNGNGSGVSPQHQQGSAGGASNTGGGASAALLALGKPLNVNAPNFTLPTSAPAGANGTSPNAGGGSGGGGDAASNLPADLGVDEEFVSSALPDLSSPSPATGGLRILALAVYRPVGPAGTSACAEAGTGQATAGHGRVHVAMQRHPAVSHLAGCHTSHDLWQAVANRLSGCTAPVLHSTSFDALLNPCTRSPPALRSPDHPSPHCRLPAGWCGRRPAGQVQPRGRPAGAPAVTGERAGHSAQQLSRLHNRWAQLQLRCSVLCVCQ